MPGSVNEVTLEDIEAFLCGKADERTRERVAKALDDPESEVSRLFSTLRTDERLLWNRARGHRDIIRQSDSEARAAPSHHEPDIAGKRRADEDSHNPPDVQSPGAEFASTHVESSSGIGLHDRSGRRRLVGAVAAAIAMAFGFLGWRASQSRVIAELHDGPQTIRVHRDGRIEGDDLIPDSMKDGFRESLLKGEQRRSAATQALVAQRGPASDYRGLIAPIDTAVLESEPTFSWKTDDATGSEVIVTITPVRGDRTLDPDRARVQSLPLTMQKWTSSERLAPGFYIWNLTIRRGPDAFVIPGPGKTQPLFKVLGAEEVSEVESLRARIGNAHLSLGYLFQDHALLDEADREYALFLADNPDSATARSLVRSVRAMRR